jgi:prepilin-type N-terminal cleavage/methylation domain-containing protein
MIGLREARLLIKRIIQSTPIRSLTQGFTLVEMLSVLGIISILAVVSFPALQSMQQSGNFAQSVYKLADGINYARSYAMSQNTYVYLGLTEVDRTQNPGATPQVPGYGRVVLAMVATTNATSYDGVTVADLTQIRPPQPFDLLYLAPTLPTATTGGMVRPSSTTNFESGSPIFSTQFALPLGSPASSTKYNFSNCIAFNPQGGIGTTGSSAQWVEIDLQPSTGATIPAPPASANQGNQAAIVIDGATGALTIFRP